MLLVSCKWRGFVKSSGNHLPRDILEILDREGLSILPAADTKKSSNGAQCSCRLFSFVVSPVPGGLSEASICVPSSL